MKTCKKCLGTGKVKLGVSDQALGHCVSCLGQGLIKSEDEEGSGLLGFKVILDPSIPRDEIHVGCVRVINIGGRSL